MATTTKPTQTPTVMPTPAPTDPVTTTMSATSTAEEAAATTDGSDSVARASRTGTQRLRLRQHLPWWLKSSSSSSGFRWMSSPSLTQSTSTLLNDHVNQWAGVSDGPFVITLTAGSIIVTVRFHEGGQTDADSPAAGQAEFLMGISFSRNDGTSEQIQSATVIEPSTTLPQSGCRQEPCHGHLLRPPPPRFFHTPPPPTGGVLPATRQTTTKLRCWRMRPGVSDRPVCGRRNSTADPRRVLHRCKRRKTKSISAGPDMVIADSAVAAVSAPNNAVSTNKAKAGAAAFDRIVINECFEINADGGFCRHDRAKGRTADLRGSLNLVSQ